MARLDEGVRQLQEIVVGQPQLLQRPFKRWQEDLVPQGLQSIVRQLQASQPERAKPRRKVGQHVAVHIERLGAIGYGHTDGGGGRANNINNEFVSCPLVRTRPDR